jgi:hypothetical protein
LPPGYDTFNPWKKGPPPEREALKEYRERAFWGNSGSNYSRVKKVR